MAPTFMLPFGEGRRFLSHSRVADALVGGWSITPVVTVQSGFPIGISQNQPNQSFLFGNNLRPNIVPWQDFLVPGDITDRITGNTSDNLYLNKAAFAQVAANQFGNAPRILPGVFSPWRNNVDLGVGKNVKTGGRTSASVRIEVLNMFNTSSGRASETPGRRSATPRSARSRTRRTTCACCSSRSVSRSETSNAKTAEPAEKPATDFQASSAIACV